ncbi:sperm microtubule associated protein 2 [Ctenodactylus gundi]
MGDKRQSLSEDGASVGQQSTVYASRQLQEADEAEWGPHDPIDDTEDIPPEEVTEEHFPEVPDPEEELQEPEPALEQELEEEIDVSRSSVSKNGQPPLARLSASEKQPSTPMPRGRRLRRRLMELSKPKTDWQTVRDRSILHFCLYWPSVYWTERFLEDTTLTVTVPAVSCRVDELARPKRFYLEYYNNNRTSPAWPVPRSTLEHSASSRLKELATPRVRKDMWSIHVSEVSQVSRAARMAVPSPRILQLAKPRAPAPLLEEWDPMPKPKPHVSDYNRLIQLAMPKAQSDKCIPDRSPRWEVLDAAKKAVASERIISLAQPKARKNLNEAYNPYYISPASLMARASPRLYELATPKSITKKV